MFSKLSIHSPFTTLTQTHLAETQSPLKVLHVIPSIALVQGGPSQAVLESVRFLRSNGVEAEIATLEDEASRKETASLTLGQRVQHHGVPVWFFANSAPSTSAFHEFGFSTSFTTWLWHQIHSYDLVHVHCIFSYPATSAMTIARLRQVPYICRPLGQLCEWVLQRSALKKKIYLSLIERANLNGCQGLHFTSIQEQQEAAKLCLTAPSFVLPHGLATAPEIPDAHYQLRQHLQLPAEEPILLYMSRLHPKKGLDLLIPAVKQLTRHRFTLVIAGSGTPEYEVYVDDCLKQAGLQERTRRLGFVTGELKQLLLQGSDLFVLTSHSENFGVAVLEAIAAGLPCIVTPGVALASVVQEHQLGYVPNLEISAISSAIEAYLQDSAARQAMGLRGRKLALEKYGWDSVVSQLISIYQDIVDDHQRR